LITIRLQKSRVLESLEQVVPAPEHWDPGLVWQGMPLWDEVRLETKRVIRGRTRIILIPSSVKPEEPHLAPADF